jgi:hypothetical protein
MFNNAFAAYTTAKPSFNFGTPSSSSKTLEELETEAKKLETEKSSREEREKAEKMPNHVIVLIEAAKGDIRNRNDQDRQAVANGVLYGKIQRIIKGKSFFFETRDGNFQEDSLTVDQRIALDLGPDKVDALCDEFMELSPGQGGRRAAEIIFAFPEEVFMNSMSTIMTDGIILGEFKVPKGQPPATKEEYLKKKNEVISSSTSYREGRRKQAENERKAQMLAAMGIEAPEELTTSSGADPAEEEFDANVAM